MFINISNHPSAGWGTRQKKEAEIYGEIVDIPFPSISFTDSSENINQKVETAAAEIFSLLSGRGDPRNAVMAEGEFVFTYRLVCVLKRRGICVLAAKTRRIAEEHKNPDGSISKISRFQFEGFREY